MDESNNGYHLMIVDDDPAALQIMACSLENRYKVNCIESGDACLSELKIDAPDVIILDVDMPTMDGYEVCRNIRRSKKTRDIPVIFLSGKTDLKSKLAGYDVGGDDYLVKPIDIEELCAKVDTSLSLRKQHNEKLSATKAMARSVMDSSAEIGIVLQYCEKTFNASSFNQIASDLLRSLEEFHLNCCVRVNTDQGSIDLSTGLIDCTPMEKDLLNAIRWADRITELGKRSAYNFNCLYLLVKNMPIDDPELCGRYRDHIAIMLSAAASKVDSMISIQKNEDVIMEKVNLALHDISSCLKDISDDFVKREKATTSIMNSLLSEVNLAFSTLELTIEQEDFFVKLVNQHLDEIVAMFYENHQIDAKFENVMQVLQGIQNKKIITQQKS